MTYAEKEDYVHRYSVEWRRGHIYTELFAQHSHRLGLRVLQLGCNAGTTLAVLREQCRFPPPRRFAGWDINPEAIRAARDLLMFTDVQLCVRNALDPVVHEGICDTVLALDFVEHIYPEDMRALRENLRRMVAPGGKLWVFVPRAGGAMDTDPTHVQHFEHPAEVLIRVAGEEGVKSWALVHEERVTRENPDPVACPGVHDALFVILERV